MGQQGAGLLGDGIELGQQVVEERERLRQGRANRRQFCGVEGLVLDRGADQLKAAANAGDDVPEAQVAEVKGRPQIGNHHGDGVGLQRPAGHQGLQVGLVQRVLADDARRSAVERVEHGDAHLGVGGDRQVAAQAAADLEAAQARLGGGVEVDAEGRAVDGRQAEAAVQRVARTRLAIEADRGPQPQGHVGVAAGAAGLEPQGAQAEAHLQILGRQADPTAQPHVLHGQITGALPQDPAAAGGAERRAIEAQAADLAVAVGVADREHAVPLPGQLQGVANDPGIDAAAADGNAEQIGSLGDAAAAALQSAAIEVDHQAQAAFNIGVERALGAAREAEFTHLEGQVERHRGRGIALLESDRDQKAAVDRVKADAGAKGQHPRAVDRFNKLLQGADRLALLVHDRLQPGQAEGQAPLDRHGRAVEHLGDRVGSQHHLTAQHHLAEGDLLAGVTGHKAAARQLDDAGDGGSSCAAQALAAGGDAVEAGQVDSRPQEVDAVVDVGFKRLGKAQHRVEPLVDKGQRAGERIGIGDRLEAVNQLREHQNDVHQRQGSEVGELVEVFGAQAQGRTAKG